jgi:hypothetical protein
MLSLWKPVVERSFKTVSMIKENYENCLNRSVCFFGEVEIKFTNKLFFVGFCWRQEQKQEG